MKKILLNKKVLISLVIVAIIAAAGFTYAWLTSKTSITADASAGRIRVSAKQYEEYTNDETNKLIRLYVADPGFQRPDLEEFTPTEAWLDNIATRRIYEPGTEGVLGFEVLNPNPDGEALELLAKIGKLEGTVEIWSDVNGEKLTAPVTMTLDSLLSNRPGSITYTDLSEPICTLYKDEYNHDLGMVVWFYDRTTFLATGQKEYYVAMTPGMSTDCIGELAFDGSKMENEFSGAKFYFDCVFEATQTTDAAVQAKWPGIFLVTAAPYKEVTVSTDSTSGIMKAVNATKASQANKYTAEEALKLNFPNLFK